MMLTRVLHVVASSRGGGATHVRSLALGLDPARFDVRVAMPNDGGHVCGGEFESAGVSFTEVNIESGFSPAGLRRLRAMVAQVDILHVHGARAALFGRLAAASLGSSRPQIVYTIHGFSLPFYPIYRRWPLVVVERLAARVTDLVIAVSEDERRAVLSHGIVPAERVKVIRNGVCVTPFRAAEQRREPLRVAMGFSDDVCVIATICRLHKPRDFETLLKAFACLVKTTPRVHLLIVGDGPEQSRVVAMRDELGLTAWVTLTGGRGDIPDVLAASDVFTLTTWGWEGLPFTILEAMAAAKPVVATCAGGVPEAVSEGVTGLVVRRRDVDGLADAFSRLVHNPELCARMGSAGRDRVEDTFSRERMVQLTASAYMELLSHSSGGDPSSV